MLWTLLTLALAGTPDAPTVLAELEKSNVPLEKIEVMYDVDDGVVSIEGEVPTLKDRDALVSQAKSIEGVKRVEANLKLASGEMALPVAAVEMPESHQLDGDEVSQGTHDALYGKVMFELVRSPKIDSTGVIVSGGDDGAVVLEGFVQTASERRAAERIAERAGATRIQNEIKVVGEPGALP